MTVNPPYPTVGPGTPAALATCGWSELPPAPIEGREPAAVVWTGRELLVWGGASQWRRDRGYADGAAYDPRRGTWRRIPAAPVGHRIGAAIVWTGRVLLVWGGYVGRVATGDGAAYDPESDTWRTVAPSPLKARVFALAVRTGERVIVLGGRGEADPFGHDVAVYDPGTDEWERLPSVPEQPGHEIQQVGAVATDDRIDVFAGWAHTESFPARGGINGYGRSGIDRFRFDPTSHAWTFLPDDPDAPTSIAQAIWTGREIIMPPGYPWRGGGFGGPAPHHIGAGWRLDPVSDRWRRIAEGPRGGSAAWTGAALLTFNHTLTEGSTPGPFNHIAGPTEMWDPGSDAWTELPTAGWAGGAGVWTGQELLVWGEMLPSYPMGYGGDPTPPPRTLGLRFGT